MSSFNPFHSIWILAFIGSVFHLDILIKFPVDSFDKMNQFKLCGTNSLALLIQASMTIDIMP